jgi:octaprenyl-diphosphate synthase
MTATTLSLTQDTLTRSTAAALSGAAVFHEYIRPDLEAVEARLDSSIGSEVRTISALTNQILRAGGKRLRPAMVALSARSQQPDIDATRITTIGAAVELIHMASLVHDDVVDATGTRRGKPTANAVFGNSVAVISGDYILSRAFRLLAEDGDPRLLRIIADITVTMSEGEVLEIAAGGRYDLPMAEYLEILRKKTAVFLEGCCRCGAVLADADERTENALAQYGCRLGMAFQLADDLLDYVGDPAITGKPRGSDLRDGRATMPFLLALQDANPADREQLLTAFGDPTLDDAAVLHTCAVIAAYDGFDRTRDFAQEQVELADVAIVALPSSPARDCFRALTSYVVLRDR